MRFLISNFGRVLNADPFFWVIPRRLNVSAHCVPPMKLELTEVSDTLAYKLQTPVNHAEKSIQ
jgi:hypothetical protein